MNKSDLYKNSGIDIDEDWFKDVTESAQDTVKAFLQQPVADFGGSVGCAVRLETRRLRVQPPLRSATFFHGD